MDSLWKSCLGKGVRTSLCASSGIFIDGKRHSQLKSGIWEDSKSTARSLTIHVGIPEQLWSVLGVSDIPRNCCHGEPQGEPLSQLPRKGSSLGQGGGRSVPEGPRGTDGSPMWQRSWEWRGSGRDWERTLDGKVLFECVFVSLSECILMLFFFLSLSFTSMLPLTVIGKGFSFSYLNGQIGNANTREKVHPKLPFCSKLRTGTSRFLFH